MNEGNARSRSCGIRKSASQKRSQLMVQAILQAAAETFSELGYARTTTNKIAERAGVSVGSLYQYFPNKDSLLAALLARHHQEVHQVVGKGVVRLADAKIPLEDGLRLFLIELADLHQADPALSKALSAAVLRESPAAEGIHDNEDDAAWRGQLGALLSSRRDVREGSYAAMAVVLGQILAHLARWLVHDAPPDLERESLLEEIVQVMVRYLAR